MSSTIHMKVIDTGSWVSRSTAGSPVLIAIETMADYHSLTGATSVVSNRTTVDMSLVITSLSFTNPSSSAQNLGFGYLWRTSNASAAGFVHARSMMTLIGTGSYVTTSTIRSPGIRAIRTIGTKSIFAIAAVSGAIHSSGVKLLRYKCDWLDMLRALGIRVCDGTSSVVAPIEPTHSGPSLGAFMNQWHSGIMD